MSNLNINSRIRFVFDIDDRSKAPIVLHIQASKYNDFTDEPVLCDVDNPPSGWFHPESHIFRLQDLCYQCLYNLYYMVD